MDEMDSHQSLSVGLMGWMERERENEGEGGREIE